MKTKLELLKRLEELKRQVRELQARPVYMPVYAPPLAPLVGDPFPWIAPTAPTWPYIVTCSATDITLN